MCKCYALLWCRAGPEKPENRKGIKMAILFAPEYKSEDHFAKTNKTSVSLMQNETRFCSLDLSV